MKRRFADRGVKTRGHRVIREPQVQGHRSAACVRANMTKAAAVAGSSKAGLFVQPPE
jgi:hypothetical protein